MQKQNDIRALQGHEFLASSYSKDIHLKHDSGIEHIYAVKSGDK